MAAASPRHIQSETSPSDGAPPMALLQISLPTGAAAGQRIQFTTPDMQRMEFTVQSPIEPGSSVNVQYPLLEQTVAPCRPAVPSALPSVASEVLPQSEAIPHTNLGRLPVPAPAPVVGPLQQAPPDTGRARLVNGVLIRPQQMGGPNGVSPPIPEVVLQPETADHQAMVKCWWMYSAGWLSCCLCGPPGIVMGMIFWITGAATYYCKRRCHRSHFPRQRVPAIASLVTCLCVALLAIALGIHLLNFFVSERPCVGGEGHWSRHDVRHRWNHFHQHHKDHGCPEQQHHAPRVGMVALRSFRHPHFTEHSYHKGQSKDGYADNYMIKDWKKLHQANRVETRPDMDLKRQVAKVGADGQQQAVALRSFRHPHFTEHSYRKGQSKDGYADNYMVKEWKKLHQTNRVETRPDMDLKRQVAKEGANGQQQAVRSITK